MVEKEEISLKVYEGGKGGYQVRKASSILNLVELSPRDEVGLEALKVENP